MRADRALEARILLAGSPRAPDAESLWQGADPVALGRAAALARALERRGVRALLREEEGYPGGLRDLPDAPPAGGRPSPPPPGRREDEGGPGA